MAGPIMNDYIYATRKSFILNDHNGKMIEKNFIEIEGTFLVKIRDNAFNGKDGENVFEHINSFLEVVEQLKIRGLSHDRFRLSVFPISLSGAANKWFRNECVGTISTWDDLVEKFIQKFYNLFYHNEEEEAEDDNDPNEIDDVPEILKSKTTLNTNEVCPFTRWDNRLRGPYANAKSKRTFDPYLNIDRKPEWNYETNNGGNIHNGQRCMENLTYEPSACKIRRFEMVKYTFEADEECIAIKELEHINHSEINMDARYAYWELFHKMDDGWLVTRATNE
ncbi:hypothetical protein Tco_0938120 [Tanacetum coccineum]|uniref:Retrotransposon gag domain-containing protein n=1 Tax=Tanacetum coccineum TaxID=301880 RepID=A0ABQ5DG70_9ASTR